MLPRPFASHSPQYRQLRGLELPPALDEMRTPPLEVHLWGTMPPGPYVSIVGTRDATRVGERAAFRLARDLARRGVTIISGGASGIDTMAHLGALEGGGPTLVVAPTWWETASPKSNRAMFETIVAHGGGYLTLAPQGKPLFNPIYFLRNEALMALSHACVLGECRFQSGAKNAMLHARRMGRARFCLPYLFSHPTSEGPWEEMIRYGAAPLRSADDLLPLLREAGTFDNPRWWRSEEQLVAGPPARSQAKPVCLQAEPVQQQAEPVQQQAEPVRSSKRTMRLPGANSQIFQCPIGEAISRGCGTVDEICRETQQDPAEVQHQILILTLEGRVFEDDAGVLRYHSPRNA